MKLNYKRTVFVGMAFFLILAFWQAYDGIIPLILKNTFGIGEGATGQIMAIDNMLARKCRWKGMQDPQEGCVYN